MASTYPEICEVQSPSGFLPCGHHESNLRRSIESDYTECGQCETVKGLRDLLNLSCDALRAANGILWMAEEYAEGGGSHSIEMQNFKGAKEGIVQALAILGKGY